jgi:hypothetical protein
MCDSATTVNSEVSRAQSRITTRIGGVHAIPFPEEAFVLALALGVLPWLKMGKALREISRVFQPSGYLIARVNTRWLFRQFFDSFSNPLLERPRKLAASILGCGARPHVVSAFAPSLSSAKWARPATKARIDNLINDVCGRTE